MNAEKWHHSEICIAINDKTQGSIAKNLRCDELLYYTFDNHSAGERIFKIGEHLVKLWPRVWCLVFFDSRCSRRHNAGVWSSNQSLKGAVNQYKLSA